MLESESEEEEEALEDLDAIANNKNDEIAVVPVNSSNEHSN